MRDLITSPSWRESDLGLPLPDSGHAVSVTMPRWRDVVGYEEGEQRVLDALACGYPRFVIHPLVQRLNHHIAQEWATSCEAVFAFPSAAVARRAREYLQRRVGADSRVVDTGFGTIHALLCDAAHYDVVKSFWQHTGDIVSSRWAEQVLTGATVPYGAGTQAKTALRAQLAELAGVAAHDVLLFPTGMAAVAFAHRVAAALAPGRESCQLGFPYVDTLKVQEKLGAGVVFLPRGDAADLERLEAATARDEIGAVFTECPANPLLTMVDLARVGTTCRGGRIPLVVDVTLDCFANLNPFPHADVAVVSLTKYFSGAGDVMGGALVLNPDSPLYEPLRRQSEHRYEDNLWPGDAVRLQTYGADFRERFARVSETTRVLCERLAAHPKVAAVHYPSLTCRETYTRYCRSAEPGFGGLFSLELVDGAVNAPQFYDRLQLCKGPSLGTNFTLVCPYTLLAHYHELAWAASCGVNAHLIRVSVGLESLDTLWARFSEALEVAPIEAAVFEGVAGETAAVNAYT